VTGRRTTLVGVGLVLAFLAPMSTAYALWSSTATASLDVSVAGAATAPSAPTISCGGFVGNGQFSITWTNVSGLTYSVHRSTTANADPSYSSQAASTTTPYTASVANNSTTYWRVKANNGTLTSGWSNTLRLERSGNGNGSISCTGVSP
jgi:hypothetical protein